MKPMLSDRKSMGISNHMQYCINIQSMFRKSKTCETVDKENSLVNCWRMGRGDPILLKFALHTIVEQGFRALFSNTLQFINVF